MGEDRSLPMQPEGQHHVFSTFFPSRTVQGPLSTKEGLEAAVEWCRRSGITKAYVESFRDGLQADRQALERARDRFQQAGIEASGAMTTTGMVKPSERGWGSLPCFTDEGTQQQLQDIFEFTAPLFDEIMIDDFFATGCRCRDCEQARGEESWAEYRSDLMCRISAERVLEPAHRANPSVKVIIKYPMWYDEFQERGYEVGRQTELFDRTWVGTEARDIDDPQQGGCATYRPFWLMRWLGQIGAEKCGGGWYDPFGTHEDTYLEQARQTVLGGARESVQFCYPHLISGHGQRNMEALCREMPRLAELAAWVNGERPRGVTSYKPIGSPGDGDDYVFDWVGMVGVPLIPDHRFSEQTPSAFLSAHSAADPAFADRARALLADGGGAIFTSRAADAVGVASTQRGAFVLNIAEPRRVMELPEEQLAALRQAALAPLDLGLEGPPGVALYLFGERKIVLESFQNRPVDMRVLLPEARSYRTALVLGRDGSEVAADRTGLRVAIPPRTLVALER
jgi:hypothetical protein